jgi:DNA-directed RNA polymerase specialized sigma subunit
MLVNKYLLNYHNLRPYKQDFYQDALISLTNSFENFDKSLNVPLFSYIINNINYAFLNEVDDLSDIKRSKGVTQNLRLLAKLLKDNPNNEEYVRKAFKEETDI